ncbi:MAG: aminoacyl-tRNA hydrolase [Desulfopila sp.]|jgi:PTH1 family peptidyl-tRNA hydrolase|nr:aminoacyl-tRNA hydrolase [Desulfopila sp.]
MIRRKHYVPPDFSFSVVVRYTLHCKQVAAMSSDTFIITGLGNPGEQYNGTRHNVGFAAVDELNRLAGDGVFLKKWEAATVKVSLWGATVHLVKPLTYMNRSGRAVAGFVDFYKIKPEQLIVIHDDLDMRPGRLKLVSGGGSGGHNGIRSIVDSLGESSFFRLKIGIGRPGSGTTPAQMPVEKYVLTAFNSEEVDIITARYAEIAKGLQLLIENDPLRAMNYLNSFK